MSSFLFTPRPTFYVSTIHRESSALVNTPPWFYETMAWTLPDRRWVWQSAANNEREALRQHHLAVRWLSR